MCFSRLHARRLHRRPVRFIKFVQQRLQVLAHQGEVGFDGGPHNVEVNLEIIVRHDTSHLVAELPRHIGVLVHKRGIVLENLVARFTDDFDVGAASENGI